MGRVTVFIGLIWLMVCMAGAVMAKTNAVAATKLTATITDSSTTIPVTSTAGFPSTGTILIGSEKISYGSKTATTFKSAFASPLIRGADGTTAVAHAAGSVVRTREAYLINAALDYSIASISDSAGIMLFITVPKAIFDILKNFFTLPLSFLHGDLEVLAYLWGILLIGFVITLVVTMVGGRRG